jgi:NAD(P)H-dependent FMN reductase
MKIGIIIGSVREERVGAQVAAWVHEQAEGRDAVYEIIDLKDFDLPMCTSATVAAAAGKQYADERVTRWSRAIDQCDAFVVVTPEYNHGVPGALKNAFDLLFPEWWTKAIAFVAYGSAYGLRAIEHWRLVVATANMYDIKAQVALSTAADFQDGKLNPTDRHVTEMGALFNSLESAGRAMVSLRG